MRGEDKRQRAMLVVINPEQRVPTGPSAAAHQSLGGRGAEATFAGVR